MLILLAKAQGADASAANLRFIIIACGLIMATAAAAMLPMLIAWSRKCRHASALGLILLLWAILTASSAVYTTSNHDRWASEQQRLLLSGDYDPQDLDESFAYPWPLWTALGAAYLALLGWSAIPQRR